MAKSGEKIKVPIFIRRKGADAFRPALAAGGSLMAYGDTLLTAVAAQTENLPDDIENLVMTCGSGITATGVMIGLHRYWLFGEERPHYTLFRRGESR